MAAAQEKCPKETAYQIKYTKKFRRDLKRMAASGRYHLEKLHTVIGLLAEGQTLPAFYRNHTLVGNFNGCEECHIESDWLLVYQRDRNALLLILVRTGTHSKLFNE